jgi:hypothetical protein
MKKLSILYLLFCLIAFDLHAQETLEAFPKKAKDFTVKGVPGKGFLLGFDTGDKMYELRRYDNDFNIVWKNQFKATETYFTSYPVIFSSADGDYSYMTSETTVEGIVTYASKNHIWRINSVGDVSKMEYKPDKNSILKQFSIGETLYTLSRIKDKGIELKDGVTGLEKINVGSKIQGETIKIKLSEQPLNENCTGWGYSAHDNKNIYLNSRTIDLKNNQYECKVAVIDTNGNLMKEITVKGTTKECMYSAQSLQIFPASNYENSSDIRFHGEGMYSFKAGSSVRLLIDTANKSFYVYGLQGKCGPVPDNFSLNSVFIHKYNFEGEAIFKVEKEVSPVFKKNWVLGVNQTKYIVARIDKNNNFEVCPATLIIKGFNWQERTTYHITVSPGGEILKTNEINYFSGHQLFSDEAQTILDSDTRTSSTKGNLFRISVYDTGKGKAVVRYDEKEKVTKLQVYKN